MRQLALSPAIRSSDFRLLWVSTFFNAIGMMGEILVLGWLVLEITDSPFMVGVSFALRMAPLFFFGIPAGALSDRVGRLKLIGATNLLMAVATAAIGVLVLFDTARLWHILLLSFGIGSVRALYQTARQTFAYDLVGRSGAVNSLALITLAMWTGGMVGSLLAGQMAEQLGIDVAYMVLAAGYILSAAALLPVRRQQRVETTGDQSVTQNLREYASELRRNRALATLVFFTSAAEILGWSYQVLLPSLAKDILNVGAGGLGVMNAFRSIGAIVAIVGLSMLGEIRRKGPLYLGALVVFGAFVVLLGFVTNYYLALGVILVITGSAVIGDILSQGLMQLIVPDSLRGRAMGSWVLAIGTGPLGQLQIGALASAFSIGVALVTNGVGLAVLALMTAARSKRLRSL